MNCIVLEAFSLPAQGFRHRAEQGPSENFRPLGDEPHTDASSWVFHDEGKETNTGKGVQSQVSEGGAWPGPRLEE